MGMEPGADGGGASIDAGPLAGRGAGLAELAAVVPLPELLRRIGLAPGRTDPFEAGHRADGGDPSRDGRWREAEDLKRLDGGHHRDIRDRRVFETQLLQWHSLDR